MRVFVVGVPRSGTTLVQSLLAAHSAMTSFTESHFFSRHFALLPPLSTPVLIRSPIARLHEFLTENDETPSEAARWLEAKLRTRVSLPFHTRSAARNFMTLLDELSERRGKSSWIEKTPRHLRYVPFLENVSGVAAPVHFVHVIRDGVDVVLSLHEASKQWQRPYDIDECVKRWNLDVAFSLGRVDAPRDHFVFYERLIAEPEATLARLLGELGLEWESGILAEYARTAERLVTEQEAWKRNIGGGIRRTKAAGRGLSDAQRVRVTQSLHPELYAQLLERVGTQ